MKEHLLIKREVFFLLGKRKNHSFSKMCASQAENGNMLEGKGESFSAELAAAVHPLNLILVCISPLSKQCIISSRMKSSEKSIVYFVQELAVLLRCSSITCNLCHLDPLSM